MKDSLDFRTGKAFSLPVRSLLDRLSGRQTGRLFKITVNSVAGLRSRLGEIIDRVDIVSFDIFDTLFERDVDPPDKVKEVVARCVSEVLWQSHGIERTAPDLMNLRDSVELELRQKAADAGKDFECSYDDIVRRMVVRLLGRFDEDLFNRMRKREIEVEDEVLSLKPGIGELLAWLREKGKTVIAVSDMYLDREHIEQLLELKGILRFFDRVYVSSEMSICKYSGQLFKHVLASEQIPPDRMIHIGDNRISDHRVPKRLGINTIHLHDQEHLRRKYVLKTYDRIAAGNRYWRGRHLLQLIRPAESSDFFYQYSYSFLGPVYLAFVYGVVEEIRRHRIPAAFFLAREGELFLRIFQTVAPHLLGEDRLPATSYVYLTRKSTALAAAYRGLTREKAGIALYNPKQQGLLSIFNVFGLPPDEFAGIAARHGFTEVAKPIHDPHDRDFAALLADPEFQRRVTAHAQVQRDLLGRYLEQSGFFSARSVAFVDIGWNATIQKFIQDAFAERPDYPRVHGLYLGFCNGMKHDFDSGKNTVRGVLYDEGRNDPAEKTLMRFEEVFEEGARALHPTTVGYRENPATGLIEPVFKDDTALDRKAEILHNEKITRIQRGAIDFAAEFLRAVDLTGYTFGDIRPFILTLIERCIAFPDAGETDHLMNLTHSEDFGYDNVMDFSSDRIESVRTAMNPVRLIDKIDSSNWPYGTARSSGIPGLNLILRLYDLVRRS